MHQVKMFLQTAVLCVVFSNEVLSIYVSNSTKAKIQDNNPAKWTESAVWGPVLEEWATMNTHRETRVMRLNGFVITDRIADEEKEGKVSNVKIVTKKPPGRQVSETDLYLLGAIEKLAYRLDFMEKRLRRVEEMVYYVMAGNRVDHDPCPENFTRVGSNCYSFKSDAGRELDWQTASKQCKKLGANLAEMETIEENQDIVAYLQITKELKGKDFWTGGLNPGLLWIWSNSARPVPTKKEAQNNPANIPGEGRCLRLAYDPALRSYSYRGTDCGVRFSFVCELPENSSSNQIRRLGRSRNILDEL